jgi:hypothetical protein
MRRSARFCLNLASSTPIPSYFLERVGMRTDRVESSNRCLPAIDSGMLYSEREDAEMSVPATRESTVRYATGQPSIDQSRPVAVCRGRQLSGRTETGQAPSNSAQSAVMVDQVEFPAN